MNEYHKKLRTEFMDEDYRYAYAEDFLNTYIATQLRVLREQREMSQAELADAIGTKQAGISRLENVNYDAWKTQTLRKLARALGVRLKITFETFGSLLPEASSFGRESLGRPKFEDDPAFEASLSAPAVAVEDALLQKIIGERQSPHFVGQPHQLGLPGVLPGQKSAELIYFPKVKRKAELEGTQVYEGLGGRAS